LLRINTLEERARRAARRYDGLSIAIIGCAAEGIPAEWCPMDVVAFPSEEEGQEIWRERGSVVRIIVARRPPREEIPSMIIVDDRSMEAAALKASWKDRREELARAVARRDAMDAAESTARGLEAADATAVYYYAMKSFSLLTSSAVAAAGSIPRPAHLVRQARALDVLPPGPPGELAHVKRVVDAVGRILYSELDEEVEGYVFRRKAEALIESGLLLDAITLAFYEASRRIGDDLALAHMRSAWSPEDGRAFLMKLAAEESRIWRHIRKSGRG